MTDNDFRLFSELCRNVKQTISIRGSTAYALSRNDDSEDIPEGSIVHSVPPLGDLDLIVHDEQPHDAMRGVTDVLADFRARIPASRFIHVDVFYKHLPVRADSPLGNVVITHLPEIRFDGKADLPPQRVPPPSAQQPVEAAVKLRTPATLFRDFLFLLRLSQRHPELENATESVAKLLHRHNPMAIGRTTRLKGGARELARIDKALVKHLLLRVPEGRFRSIAGYLRTEWLARFAPFLPGIARTIILSEEYWTRTPAIAYAVDGRVTRFSDVTDLEPEEETVLNSKLSLDPELERDRLTPSLEVMLPTPDGPKCCEYRDFSEGISELAWRDPGGDALLNVALMEGREKYYAVHAQASQDFGAQSLRTDPGFMGALNGGALQRVRLMGVRKQ